MNITKRSLTLTIAALALVGVVGSSAVPAFAAATCASQLTIVKAQWDQAPSGPKKDAAEKHYVKAVAAQKTMDEKTCLSQLDAASMALK